ncbi:hypothetical protein [Mycolicibacterium lutetiense]|uniref:Uncharacterized protein n=1 Tax=Mycolicibacterium lutetiense TaxID=1641992 RepID=A0ABS4ZQ27_9MYCO|nr:hypothetical protein [Mycolicibacterium lutetiense]MBP2451603.1 hypothetical protein [Mycolicibacterium lutetiense]
MGTTLLSPPANNNPPPPRHLADAFIDAIEADGATGSDISGPHAQKAVGAYLQAFERILGAPAGSLHDPASSAQREP